MPINLSFLFAAKVGATVVESALVIELPFLNGRDAIGDKSPIFVLVEKEGA